MEKLRLRDPTICQHFQRPFLPDPHAGTDKSVVWVFRE
jgi:hypothetical protein